ncbi:MAG: bifunctional phosphopantothenoylcysteine decarboxylase/phosphopantothenate--cysteine ligase CoaBC [Sphingomonadales bacterium]|nr:bifunctional phosphopantothenoylcysteine decarboxylase/phosphopantothenate--cysteine ligase CoaBC [Sphingomonadales bacterium]
MLKNKQILIIISGGIAAFKALEVIRLLKKEGAGVRAILTKGGAEFITPLSVSSLTEDKVYTELFSLTDEAEMGHIRLSRQADLVLVLPATANLIERMARGVADDLASTTLLATDKTVMVCPAMNVEMWEKPATQRNIETLRKDGAILVGPEAGLMACGEEGLGRLAEPLDIMEAIKSFFGSAGKPLAGKKIIVTAGPTHEPIDPVRYIANRSSGKQGYALAEALQKLGASVALISGPTSLKAPDGVNITRVETAEEMLNACQQELPAKGFVSVAAVADWRAVETATEKLKKQGDDTTKLSLKQNPDILKTISQMADGRPELVVGFAAETENLIANAQKKLISKGCDWVVANDVKIDDTGGSVMGGDENTISIITSDGIDAWSKASKIAVAQKLARKISEYLGVNRDK